MNKIFSDKYFYIIPVIFFVRLFFTVKNDPFFGDAVASTSRCVNNIYDHNLLTVFYPTDADPAHPTLYSWLMALCWKIFGQSLFVSHLYGMIWLMLLVFVFRKLAKLFLENETTVNQATLLLLVMPVFLAQGAMMLNTVAVMTFFLAAIYGLFTQNNKWFLSATILMMLSHMQAPFFLLALAATDFILNINEQKFIDWIKQRFVFYAIPFLVLLSWLTLHYVHTGWLFLSPNYSDADSLNGISQFVKSLLIMAWRLIDFGMLPFYLVFVFLFFKKIGNRKLHIAWLSLSLIICVSMAIFLSKTIGHRYFLALGMLMIILVMNGIQYFETRKKNLLYVVLFCSLVAGNFLYYPGKNLGDGTLAYRSYFSIYDNIKNDFNDTTVFYSYTPIAVSSQFTYLNNYGLKFERINGRVLSDLPVVLQSNLNAEFSEDDKKYLKNNFYGKSYESHSVYVNVFLNPKFYAKPEGWKLRETSAFENWMINLKQKFRSE